MQFVNSNVSSPFSGREGKAFIAFLKFEFPFICLFFITILFPFINILLNNKMGNINFSNIKVFIQKRGKVAQPDGGANQCGPGQVQRVGVDTAKQTAYS